MEIRGLTVGEVGIGLAGVGGGIVPERLLVEDLIFPSGGYFLGVQNEGLRDRGCTDHPP